MRLKVTQKLNYALLWASKLQDDIFGFWVFVFRYVFGL